MRELPSHISAAFTRAPGGVLTTADLGRLGLPRPAVLALVDEHLLHRVVYGVYVDPTQPAPADRRLHLPLVYLDQRRPEGCPPELITGEVALGAREVPGFASDRAPLVLVHLTRRVRRQRGLFDLRRVDLSGVDHEVVHGVRLSGMARSIADAARSASVTDEQIRIAVGHLRFGKGLDVVAAAAEWRGRLHRGYRRVDDVRAAGVFDFESEPERRLFEDVLAHLPQPPDPQVHLARNIRVDVVILSVALVIEYHGGDHDRQVDADATRLMALRLRGYEVVIGTRSMLRDPGALLAHLWAVVAERQQAVFEGRLRLPELPPQPPRLHPLRTIHAAA